MAMANSSFFGVSACAVEVIVTSEMIPAKKRRANMVRILRKVPEILAGPSDQKNQAPVDQRRSSSRYQ
jgi:hypothetical protein